MNCPEYENHLASAENNSEQDTSVSCQAQMQQNAAAASEDNFAVPKKKSGKSALFCLILGIFSVLSSPISIISMPAAIIGLITGIASKAKNAAKILGIILCILGILLSIVSSIAMPFLMGSPLLIGLLGASSENTSTYTGDGYTLECTGGWSIVNSDSDQILFQYQEETLFLMPVGTSALSDATSNFDTSDGRSALYQRFYSYWDGTDEFDLSYGSNGFGLLNDTLYYATYTVSNSNDEAHEQFILLVSPEKNAIISFMTYAGNDAKQPERKVLGLLTKININEQTSSTQAASNGNVIYDDELYEAMDSLRNWNAYSYLRLGSLGTENTITGGWRILSEAETYWSIENGRFCWFTSINDLSDNYVSGTTRIYTGLEGLELAGYDQDTLDAVVSAGASSNVTSDDVYTLICTSEIMVTDGETTLLTTEGTTRTYIWILVDHGSEGIEAQVLDVDKGTASYYVKIAD